MPEAASQTSVNSLGMSGLIQPASAPLPTALATEPFFNRIKQCRRVARYDKRAANYLAFVQLASIRLWLRVNLGRRLVIAEPQTH